jgi:8-oxo-dGTP pyrophosphatase MutT (NUDIX family)
MRIASENLVIVTRPAQDGSFEVLTGEKQRSRFEGKRVFPGGKAEGSEPQTDAAIRELEEETGISGDSIDGLRALGRLVVHDMRPGQQRFGNIWLYGANVKPNAVATDTPELVNNTWHPIDDETLTDDMPEDVGIWWEPVRDAIVNGHDQQIVVHIQHDADGLQQITVKRPDIANQPGAIIREAQLPATD